MHAHLLGVGDPPPLDILFMLVSDTIHGSTSFSVSLDLEPGKAPVRRFRIKRIDEEPEVDVVNVLSSDPDPATPVCEWLVQQWL